MIGRYDHMVRPLVEQGNYQSAYRELLDILTIIEGRKDELVEKVHSGLGWVAAMVVLRDKMQSGGAPDASDITYYRAMAAQTRLPLGED